MDEQTSHALEALFGDKNSQAVDTIASDQEDPDVKDKQENQDDLNIAEPDQVLEESILHTSDKTAMLLMTDKDDDPGEVATDGGDDGFKWGVQEASTFKELKNRLSTTSILSLPDFNNVFFIKAYASANGIGTEGQPLKEPIVVHDWRVVLTAMQRRLWDPGIKSVFSDITLRARWFQTSEECYAFSLGMIMFDYLYRNVSCRIRKERIFKKRTKNEAKTTKQMEGKRKDNVKGQAKPKKSTQVTDKSKS
ncbi:hypothetical protein Tco_0810470 [Tanacetum coccineum]